MAAPKPEIAKAAPPGQFFGTPITNFPQYSMLGAGSWTGLPPPGPANFNTQAGTWMQPGTMSPTPTTPIPSPTGGGMTGGGSREHRGLLSGFDPSTLVSSLSPDALARLTNRWGLFGGGAALPSTMGQFYDARTAYRQANPRDYDGRR